MIARGAQIAAGAHGNRGDGSRKSMRRICKSVRAAADRPAIAGPERRGYPPLTLSAKIAVMLGAARRSAGVIVKSRVVSVLGSREAKSGVPPVQ